MWKKKKIKLGNITQTLKTNKGIKQLYSRVKI